MSIIRAPKTGNFTQIDNGIFTDNRLSLKAKGLLCTMLSNSDEWEFYTTQLATTCLDGEKAIRSAMKELAKYGYLLREQYRVNGQFAGQIFNIFEIPRSPSVNEQKADAQSAHVQMADAPNGALTILNNNNTNNNKKNSNKRQEFSEKTGGNAKPEISEEERLKNLLEQISNGR